MFDNILKKTFANINKYSKNNINKFILFLRKGVYYYEYMDDWEKITEVSSPEKVDFYSPLTWKISLMLITRS